MDLALANVDILVGARPDRTLDHVLDGRCDVTDVILPATGGVHLIPAGSGIAELAAPDTGTVQRVLSLLSLIQDRYDVVIVDTAAGMSPLVTTLAKEARTAVAVTTPEPPALTDAYALAKVLDRAGRARLGVVVNQAETADEALVAFNRLAAVAGRFLSIRLEQLGFILTDTTVPRATRAMQPYVLAAPQCPAARNTQAIAARLASTLRPAARVVESGGTL
jgi:flagellar biosynthesis protein FlhG